jgi:hypothetical protein
MTWSFFRAESFSEPLSLPSAPFAPLRFSPALPQIEDAFQLGETDHCYRLEFRVLQSLHPDYAARPEGFSVLPQSWSWKPIIGFVELLRLSVTS